MAGQVELMETLTESLKLERWQNRTQGPYRWTEESPAISDNRVSHCKGQSHSIFQERRQKRDGEVTVSGE